jgi:hypothetical protein
MNKKRIKAALKHARGIRKELHDKVLLGPGYAFSYQCIVGDIRKVEQGDHSEGAIATLENKKVK